ncbi:hypothetical protein [Jiella pelagia]|uniref:Uncharacterized protein n=1 Tax=Jiella pelagia TaxID=2986949 RepID=A0ABY7C6P6_9HYPH|nr:hypothetical protein [Jiella pelagia]WAP70926.1 hypothetical protein OH818_13715 [Jiella pelagia]
MRLEEAIPGKPGGEPEMDGEEQPERITLRDDEVVAHPQDGRHCPQSDEQAGADEGRRQKPAQARPVHRPSAAQPPLDHGRDDRDQHLHRHGGVMDCHRQDGQDVQDEQDAGEREDGGKDRWGGELARIGQEQADQRRTESACAEMVEDAERFEECSVHGQGPGAVDRCRHGEGRQEQSEQCEHAGAPVGWPKSDDPCSDQDADGPDQHLEPEDEGQIPQHPFPDVGKKHLVGCVPCFHLCARHLHRACKITLTREERDLRHPFGQDVRLFDEIGRRDGRALPCRDDHPGRSVTGAIKAGKTERDRYRKGRPRRNE